MTLNSKQKTRKDHGEKVYILVPLVTSPRFLNEWALHFYLLWVHCTNYTASPGWSTLLPDNTQAPRGELKAIISFLLCPGAPGDRSPPLLPPT